LTPEPSAGREEQLDPQKLYNYYTDMGFNKIGDNRYWCSTIGDIMDRINSIVGITEPKEGTLIGLLNKNALGTIIEEEDDADYGGGRKKRTTNKRTKRKTKKSKKSKKTRKRRN
jgi:hypothetical protein